MLVLCLLLQQIKEALREIYMGQVQILEILSYNQDKGHSVEEIEAAREELEME